MIKKWPTRVMVYIDGFNIFHFIKNHYGKGYYRINYKKFATLFIWHNEKIVGVKYFTALFTKDKLGIQRHKLFIKVLRKAGVRTIFWEFQKVKKRFSRKNNIINIVPPQLLKFMNNLLSKKLKLHIEYETYEEKKTDVNLALEIALDAYEDLYDKVILISGDNDISPSIEAIKKKFPNKYFLVVSPPGQQGHSLKKMCNESKVFGKNDLQNSLFPPIIYGIQKPKHRN